MWRMIRIIIYDWAWWSLFELFQHFFTISKKMFTNGSLRLQWLNGTGSWGVCDGPDSHQLAGSDFFVPWLAAKSQEPMTIAWVTTAYNCCNMSTKFLNTALLEQATSYFGDIRGDITVPCGYNDISIHKYHFPCIMYTISWYNRL